MMEQVPSRNCSGDIACGVPIRAAKEEVPVRSVDETESLASRLTAAMEKSMSLYIMLVPSGAMARMIFSAFTSPAVPAPKLI